MHYYYFIIPGLCAAFCLIAGLKFRSFLPISLSLLIIEAVLSIFTDISSLVFFDRSEEIHNTFLLVDTLLLSFATYSLLKPHIRNKLYPISIITFLISWLYSIFQAGFDHFANFSLAVSSLVITANYLFALYQSELFADKHMIIPTRTICFALIIYHCGTFAFFCALPYLMNDSIPNYIIDINTILDSMKYILTGVAFYIFKRNSSPKKSANG